MADLDPNSAGNYHCVLAKNGVQQYYFGKKRIGKDKIPKQVLPSIICPQKGIALVSERVKALTSTNATLEKLEKKAEQLKKKEEKKEAKKEEKKKPKKKAVQVGGEKPKSPEGKPAIGKGGLAKCLSKKPTDYEWLRFYWEETKQQDLSNIKQLIKKYEEEYETEYPYDDREAILILQEPRRSPRRTASK